jgi:hypothetical protein
MVTTSFRLTVFLLSVGLCASVWAQGISNARDGNGNLIERGAATRTYTSVPMANSAAVRNTPRHYVMVSRHRTVIVQPRR